MFLIRGAVEGDLEALQHVARHLDSVNLPNDRERLAQAVERSGKSLAGKLDRARREMLFVLEDRGADGTDTGRVIGASMIFAQHGSRRSPHVFFDVIRDERYSETLDRHFAHRVLRIGYNYDGLTEIGGLVLLPAYRSHPEQLGKCLAFVRFLYVALHREVFCDKMLSELMPPLQPDGTSLLWEALGRHFTGLTYQEADRLSRENKEFIRTLFPQDPIYVSLLPPLAQALVGQVGPHTKGVETLLRRVGFSWAHRIDPFDGGPHFQARTDDVTLIASSRRLTITNVAAENSLLALVSVALPVAPFFKAVRGHVTISPDGVALPPGVMAMLGVSAGDAVGVLPL